MANPFQHSSFTLSEPLSSISLFDFPHLFHFFTDATQNYLSDLFFYQVKTNFTPSTNIKIASWNLQNFDMSGFMGKDADGVKKESDGNNNNSNGSNGSNGTNSNKQCDFCSSFGELRNLPSIKQLDQTWNKLYKTIEQIILLNPTILFVQEISNTCSLRLLLTLLNIIASSSFIKFHAIIEFDACAYSSHCFDPLSFPSFKAVLYQSHAFLFHPLFFSFNALRFKSLHELSRDRNFMLQHPYYLASSACCMLFFPGSGVGKCHLDRNHKNACNYNTNISNDLIEWMRNKLNLDSSKTMTMDEEESYLSQLKCSRALFFTQVHLRSMKDPCHIFIRKEQIKHIQLWITTKIFDFLLKHKVRIKSFFVLGDFNDYDHHSLDIFSNQSHFLPLDQSVLYLSSLLYYSSSSYPVQLINSHSLRNQSTRFSNAYIYDYTRYQYCIGAICHILFSPDIDTSIFKSLIHEGANYLKNLY